MYRVPLNRAVPVGREFALVREAIESGFIMGGGPFTARCESLLEEWLGASKVMLTTSCTDALEMCAVLLDLQPGDEFICPSFTFPSTANAFVLHGAVPVFADIRPDTLNLDVDLIEALITDRTRFIAAMHYAGAACDMDALHALAAKHGLDIIEDNAHGLFGRYRGRPLGTLGRLATLSFHETKNISCGEGGALIVNDATLVERAEILREKGTNRQQFMRGEIPKYTWVDVGSSHIPSEILAAFLYGQLEQHTLIQRKRKRAWLRYHDALAPWAASHGVRLPTVPDEAEQAYHLYYLVLPSTAFREAMEAHLRDCGIYAVSHYQPLHQSAMGMRVARGGESLPVTEDIYSRLLRLPFFTTISDEALELVVESVTAFPG